MLSEVTHGLLHGSLLYRCGLSFLSGIILHLSFFMLRILEENTVEIVFAYILLPTLFACYLSLSEHFALSWAQSVFTSFSMTSFHVLGLLLSSATYRLIFHPLRHVPGPLGCKITGWYSFYLASKSGHHYHLLTQQWHEQYGPCVRVNPNHVSVNHPDIVQILGRSKKGNFYLNGGKDGSLQGTRNPETHRIRRRVWDKAFTVEALERYTPVILEESTVLMRRLLAAAKQDNPFVDVATLLINYSFEIMGQLTFSKKFGLMYDEKDTPNEDSSNVQKFMANRKRVELTRKSMEHVGLLLHVPYVSLIALRLPGTVLQDFIQWVEHQIEERREREAELKGKGRDLFSWLLEAEPQNVYPHRIDLGQDARLAIVAGSDTAAGAMTSALFYLAANLDKLRILQRHVDHFYTKPHSAVSSDDEYLAERVPKEIVSGKCAYLDAVINEAMRLNPVIPNGVERVIGEGGCTIEGVYLPEGTDVFWPMFTAGRTESNFPDANSFLPERWLNFSSPAAEAASKIHGAIDVSSVSGVRTLSNFHPFWIGGGTCVGKGIAFIEMRITIARIVRGFDLLVTKGENGKPLGDKEFVAMGKNCFTLEIDECLIGFKKRRC